MAHACSFAPLGPAALITLGRRRSDIEPHMFYIQIVLSNASGQAGNDNGRKRFNSGDFTSDG